MEYLEKLEKGEWATIRHDGSVHKIGIVKKLENIMPTLTKPQILQILNAITSTSSECWDCDSDDCYCHSSYDI